MSAQSPSSFKSWFKSLPIPWLVDGPVGQDEANANGTVLDQQVGLIKEATTAHMPNRAPSDALAHIGGDRQLEQGPAESDANFRIRLQTAWDDWARAGTPLELLVQLYWDGFPNAVLVQQNGLSYQLSGAPTAGVDPTGLLVIGNTNTNPTITGSPHWWTFDLSDWFCSRFAVLFPTTIPAAWRTVATARFNGTQDFVDITWPMPFDDKTYYCTFSVTVTTGTTPIVSLPPLSITQGGVRVQTSSHFSGQVDLMAWEPGTNPFANPRGSELSRLRRIIARWRPAKATCTGIHCIVEGQMIGWPVRLINASATIGTSTVAHISAT